MAVVKTKERFQARRSTYRDGKMVHLREFLVYTNDIADGTVVAITALPQPGNHHLVDDAATVTGIEVAPHENNDKIFLGQIEYTSTTFGVIQDPLKRPPDISYGNTDATESYFIDASTGGPDGKGRPVVNSAGDSFESFLDRETGELTIQITVNEAEFDVIAMDGFKHTVNQGQVFIDGTTYAAGVLKLSPPTATKAIERVTAEDGTFEDFVYYKVTYLVKARKDGWDDVLDDIGLNEFIPNPTDPTKPGKLMPIVTAAKTPVSKPWPLDGHGRKKPNPGDTPATVTRQPYKKVDWSGLKPFQAATWALPAAA